MIGQSVGPYQILAELGRGGMGEVYRARDARLNRDVAIKVLPASFAADVERLQRFELEAQAAGRLNHPNVLTVYDIGAHDGAPYLVTELLDGETLRDRLRSAAGHDPRAQTPLPLRKTLDIGRQVAMGLAAAHHAGIVHRDLKPENVFLTNDGRAKILDFGLARMTERAASDASVPTALQVTNPGTVLGTVGYMSPEQVRGKAADARSDLFALGAVLFEMAGGRRAFDRDSSAETMAAILKEDPPDLAASGIVIPPALDRLLRRCLEKNPDERFQSARDLAFAIEALDGSTAGSGSASISGAAPAIADDRSAPRRLGLIVAAGGIIIAAAAGYFAGRAGSTTSAPAFQLRQLTFTARDLSTPALSADGSSVAFVDRVTGNADIFVQRVGGENPTNVTKDSTADDVMPAWSPDGLRLAFRSNRDGGGIFVMGSAGESVRRITSEGFNPSWSPNGNELAFATQPVLSPYRRVPGSSLWRVDTTTGAKTKVYDGDAVQPSWSPDGKFLAFWGLPAASGHRAIWTIPAAGGQPTLLLGSDAMNWNPVWSRDGQFVYFLSDRQPPMSIWRIPVDPATGAGRGPVERVTLGTSHHSWLSQQSTSTAESLVFGATEQSSVLSRRTISIDPDAIGSPEVIMRTVRPLDGGGGGAVSPDGRLLAFNTIDATEDLIVMKTDGTGLVRLTNDAFRDRALTWSPDSSAIYFTSDRSGRYEMWRIRSDGSGLEQVTRDMKSGLFTFPRVSPDHQYVSVTLMSTQSAGVIDLSVPIEQRKMWPLAPPETPVAFAPLGWLADGRLVGATDGDPQTWKLVLFRIADKSATTVPIPGLDMPRLVGRRYVFCADGQGWPHVVDLTTGTTRRISAGAFNPVKDETLVDVSADIKTGYFLRTETVTNLWMIGR